MKTATILISIIVIFFCRGVCLAQEGFVDGVELTTIKAPWVVRILGHDLDITNVKAKSDQSAYFLMASESEDLNVSVFIEPIEVGKSSEQVRDQVLSMGNPAWGKFQDLAKGKIKDFSYFEFFRPEVMGKPLEMLDMYAEYVGQGYWVDLHISKALYKKEEHKLFENLVSSIAFVSKSPASDAFVVQKTKAEGSTNLWFSLWDNKKCGESFRGMSSITRSENTEESWVDYCKKADTLLGPKSSRVLIASAYTRSMPQRTDRPLAILAYHSSFAKQPSIVEMIGLVLEKNGNWTVSNYIPQKP